MRTSSAAALFWLLTAAMLAAGQEKQASSAEPKSGTDTPSSLSSSAGESAKRPALVGGAPVDPKSYVIGPEDTLLIRVWREPDLSGQVMVRPDGKISLQLLNELQAAGLTPEQLTQKISDGLLKYMTRPEVSVAVQEVHSKKYFIIGEVQKPGSYPLTIPTTVLEALVNAGGFRDFANTKKIIIMRGTKRFTFNYKDVTKGKHMEQNIMLESGDQIIVP